MKKLKIFLCDLTYDTIILVSDTIPINIGFIGSYLKKNFGIAYTLQKVSGLNKDDPLINFCIKQKT